MKRMRIPMSVALGAALSLTPLSFVSAKETPFLKTWHSNHQMPQQKMSD